jgi:hypothetical protein
VDGGARRFRFLILLGALAMIASGFLPWWRSGGDSVSGVHVPAQEGIGLEGPGVIIYGVAILALVLLDIGYMRGRWGFVLDAPWVYLALGVVGGAALAYRVPGMGAVVGRLPALAAAVAGPRPRRRGRRARPVRGRHRVRGSEALLMSVRAGGSAFLLVLGVLLAGCQPPLSVRTDDAVVVVWDAGDGTTAGQVIVPIHNDGEGYVDPDVFGRNGRQTAATLLGADGEPIPGEPRVQLDALPEMLGPGDSGYLVATFTSDVAPSDVAGATVQLNADDGDEPPEVTVQGLTLVDGDAGLGAEGRLEWDGTGSGAARAIALDEGGDPIGYVATSEVRYSAGEFSMCCFPPAVTRDAIAELEVFAIRGLDEG